MDTPTAPPSASGGDSTIGDNHVESSDSTPAASAGHASAPGAVTAGNDDDFDMLMEGDSPQKTSPVPAPAPAPASGKDSDQENDLHNDDLPATTATTTATTANTASTNDNKANAASSNDPEDNKANADELDTGSLLNKSDSESDLSLSLSPQKSPTGDLVTEFEAAPGEVPLTPLTDKAASQSNGAAATPTADAADKNPQVHASPHPNSPYPTSPHITSPHPTSPHLTLTLTPAMTLTPTPASPPGRGSLHRRIQRFIVRP